MQDGAAKCDPMGNENVKQAKVDIAAQCLSRTNLRHLLFGGFFFLLRPLAFPSCHFDGTKSALKIDVEVAADGRDPRLPANKLH